MEFFTIGERMMIYRKRAGISKSELAERSGVSLSTVTKYEADDVKNPDLDTLASISIALGVTINKLLMGIEDPKKRMELEALV